MYVPTYERGLIRVVIVVIVIVIVIVIVVILIVYTTMFIISCYVDLTHVLFIINHHYFKIQLRYVSRELIVVQSACTTTLITIHLYIDLNINT